VEVPATISWQVKNYLTILNPALQKLANNTSAAVTIILVSIVLIFSIFNFFTVVLVSTVETFQLNRNRFNRPGRLIH
jgi:hypothetical protein